MSGLRYTTQYGDVLFAAGQEIVILPETAKNMLASPKSIDLTWMLFLRHIARDLSPWLQGQRDDAYSVEDALALIQKKQKQDEQANRTRAAYFRSDWFPKLVERDGERCRGCGRTDNLTVDHIHPVLLGGTNDLSNMQILCRSCNSRKGARP